MDYVKRLNTIFKKDIKVDDRTDKLEVFGSYCNFARKRDIPVDEQRCIALLDDNNKVHLTFPLNKIRLTTKTYSRGGIKSWRNKLLQYPTIITNFPVFNSDKLDNEFFRYDLLLNYFIGSKNYHFFDKELIGSTDNLFPVMSVDLKQHPLLYFASSLLNMYENGFDLEDKLFRPKITISDYGRWYYSRDTNYQNSMTNRRRLFNNLKEKNYNILSVDLKSAEPFIMYELTEIPEILELVKLREEKDGAKIKKITNIMLHNPYKYKESLKELDILKKRIPLLDTISDKLENYNKKIIRKYRTKLFVEENYRRIVNHFPFINSEELIKEHRKYLQGHVFDKIIYLAMLVYLTYKVYPILTIHDELVYSSPQLDLLEDIKNFIEKKSNKIKCNMIINPVI